MSRLVEGNPSSDKDEGMKGYLGEDPRKQHPEMQGGQNRKERKPGGLVGCGEALRTPARHHLAGTSEQLGRLRVLSTELEGTRNCVSVCIFLPLVEAAAGLVTVWPL